MSDDGGSVDYKREQRLAALEEKKKKLAEARAKNATARPVPGTATPTTPVKQLEGVGSSWNDIVATIESMPVSATSTPVKAPTSEAALAPVEPVQFSKPRKPLSQSIGVAQVDIPPKREVQMYSRGTQTTFTSSKAEDMDAEASEGAGNAKPSNENKTHHLAARSASSEIAEPMVASERQEVHVGQDDAPEIVRKTASVLSEAEARSTLESTDFLKFMSQTTAIMDRALLLSERYDLLEGQYDAMDAAPRLEAKTDSKDKIDRLLTLFDKEYSAEQQLNDIDWNPFDKSKVISATYDQQGGSGSAILEFNLDFDGRLENRMLYAASRITAAKYWTSTDNTYNTSAGGGRLIIGGSYTGQVVLWDVRAARNRNPIVAVSNANTSAGGSGSSGSGGSSSSAGISPHKHPIYSLQVIDNRHFASVDTLGTLAIWDIYNMSHPVEELALTWVKTGFLPDSAAKEALAASGSSASPSNEVAVTGISFRDENSFFVASEDGSMYSGQRHGERKGLMSHFRGHQATLSAVKVHPAHTALPPSASSNSLFKFSLNDLVLTSSVDWSVSLWHPKLNDSKPLAVFSDFSDYVMDVAWSNYHPALFAAVDSSGVLSLWNLNSEEREIALLTNMQAAPHALHKVLWSPHQADVLVAASHTSQLHVFKVDSEIATPAADEWTKLEHTINDYHDQLRQVEREEASYVESM